MDPFFHALLAAQNADGGWGYQAGQASRLEPSAWAALALAQAARPDAAGRLDRLPALLAGWRRAGGLLAEPGLPVNPAFNALALLALQSLAMVRGGPPNGPVVDSLAGGLLGVEGVRRRNYPGVRQNNALAGWPWIESTFSWVEPTAWCVLALKRWRRGRAAGDADARIAEAEALLADRACRDGGWNFGNASVLDQDLRPYVPTTAMVLIALQDRAGERHVAAGLRRLIASWPGELSGHSLALTALALAAHHQATVPVLEALARAFEHTAFLGNLAVTAMAACATVTAHEQPAPALAI
jgi:hypothetical protein